MGQIATSEFSEERCVRPNPVLKSLLRANPLDTLVRLAVAEHYEVERTGVDDLHMLVPGFWCDHDLGFRFDREAERLTLTILFEGRVVGGRSDEVFRLVGLLNENLPAGHFDFWVKSRALAYRQTLSLAGGADLRIEQAMALIAEAMDAAERGHPAFQYMIWAGDTPEAAIERVREDMLVATPLDDAG